MASWRKRHLSTLVGAVVLLFVAECAGVCEIPSFAHGTWQHRTRGNIVIDNSTLTPYNLTFTTSLALSSRPNGTLTCHESSGNKVVLKTGFYKNTVNQTFTFYFCFEFQEITGGSILPYGLLTRNLHALTGEYTKLVQEINSTITLQMICDLTQAPASRREILVSTDTSPTFSNCTSELQAKYINDDASCADTIQSCEATGPENIAITSQSNCTPPLFYTAGSSVGCLYTETDSSSGQTYLYVYNSDATVSSSNQTYRITCLALQKTNSTLYLSQSPNSCLTGMTPTANANKTYVFTETEPCGEYIF